MATIKQTLEFLRRSSTESFDETMDPGALAKAHGITDPGRVRARNEDQFVIARMERTLFIEGCGLRANNDTSHTDAPIGRLLMVADGMGGQPGGDVASAVLVDAMLSYAFSMMPWLRNNSSADERALADGLTQAVQRSQARMQEVAVRKGFEGLMGSTLTLAYVSWPMLYLVHVGDSRAYLFRGGELFRLTRDHNLAEEMVRMNVMSEAEARASRFASVLTNAVSTSERDIRVELHQAELRLGDRLLLCTDGLYGEVGDERIKSELASINGASDVEPTVQRLVDAANEAGGGDNITAVLALF